MFIERIIKRYPAYTHDQVFELEYDFAMMLLMLEKDDTDFSRRYDKNSKELQPLKSK